MAVKERDTSPLAFDLLTMQGRTLPSGFVMIATYAREGLEFKSPTFHLPHEDLTSRCCYYSYYKGNIPCYS